MCDCGGVGILTDGGGADTGYGVTRYVLGDEKDMSLVTYFGRVCDKPRAECPVLNMVAFDYKIREVCMAACNLLPLTPRTPPRRRTTPTATRQRSVRGAMHLMAPCFMCGEWGGDTCVTPRRATDTRVVRAILIGTDACPEWIAVLRATMLKDGKVGESVRVAACKMMADKASDVRVRKLLADKSAQATCVFSCDKCNLAARLIFTALCSRVVDTYRAEWNTYMPAVTRHVELGDRLRAVSDTPCSTDGCRANASMHACAFVESGGKVIGLANYRVSKKQWAAHRDAVVKSAKDGTLQCVDCFNATASKKRPRITHSSKARAKRRKTQVASSSASAAEGAAPQAVVPDTIPIYVPPPPDGTGSGAPLISLPSS